ncbi:MAG: septal ring lytic transglycosylase RlpA family protein [Lautropia sp.]
MISELRLQRRRSDWPLRRPREARLAAPGPIVTAIAIGVALGAGGCTITGPAVPPSLAAPAAASVANAGNGMNAAGPGDGAGTAMTGTVAESAAAGDGAAVASTVPRRFGGGYLDDGPGADDSAELARLAALPDPAPIDEPLLPRANRPYRALGNDYQPMTERLPFRQRGVASWYGKRYHGQSTSSGERYDMYRMTAAHPTLPLPSFVRVTNLDNGRSVVVRVNDRGPFLRNRAIDLSYLAAYKLDYLGAGSAPVEVELLGVPPAAPGDTMAAATAVRSAPTITPIAASAAGTPEVRAPAIAAQAVVAPAAGAPAVGTPAVGTPAVGTPAVGMPAVSMPAIGTSAFPSLYLQFGAFRSRENAIAALERLQRSGVGSTAPLRIVATDGVHRVHAGPYADRPLAERAGAAYAVRLGMTPMLVER